MTVSLRDGESLADYAFRVTAERDAALADRDIAESRRAQAFRDLISERDAALALLREARAVVIHNSGLRDEYQEWDDPVWDQIDALLKGQD